MLLRNNQKETQVIDLREYRQRKDKARKVEEAAPEEDVLTKVAYYLLMASRTIAGQRKH